MIGNLWVAAAVLVIANAASGQTAGGENDAPAIEKDTRKLTFQLTPGVWMNRLDGTAKLGPSVFAEHIDLKQQFDLHDLEPSINGELMMTVNGDWQLVFTGFDFSTEGEGEFTGFSDFGSLRFFTGDRYRASFDVASYSAEWMFPLAEPIGSIAGPAEGEKTAFSFSGQVGLRWTDVEQTVESLDFGGSETTGGEWLAPFLGLRLDLQYEPDPAWPLVKRLEIDASAGAGPSLDGGGGFWQVRAGLTAYFAEQFGLTFGYRLLEMDFSDDDYDMDAGLQGLFVAGTIRF